MSLLNDLRLMGAQISYLRAPRLPGDGGGAATQVTGALTGEVDLAHRTLKRCAWGEGVAALFVLSLCALLPLWLAPLMVLGGGWLIVHRGAQHTLMLAPFLPKLTALVGAITAPESYRAYAQGRLIVSPQGFNFSPQARSVTALNAQVLAAPSIKALPALYRLELKSALAARDLERAQELIASATSLDAPGMSAAPLGAPGVSALSGDTARAPGSNAPSGAAASAAVANAASAGGTSAAAASAASAGAASGDAARGDAAAMGTVARGALGGDAPSGDAVGRGAQRRDTARPETAGLMVPRALGLSAALIQAERSAALKAQGRTVGFLPPQCGGTMMYPGMPYPSSYVPEWVPGACGLLLGFGAPWTSEHERRIKSLLSDGRTVATHPGLQGLSLFHQSLGAQGFAPIVLAPEVRDLHCLITGTTGSGKTTLLNLLVNQSILAGRPTIVLDPKGDPTLKQVLVHALEQAGRDPLLDLKCCDFLAPHGARLQSRASAELFASAQGTLGSELLSPQAICAQLEQATLTSTNVGFNPLTDLSDSVPQMAQLLCCTLPHEGSSATFTAQIERAMECALYCSQVLEGTITLASIQKHFNNWDSMERALRTAFNRLVEALNQPEVSTYYNNLHGIKLSDLKRAPVTPEEAMSCAFLVRAVFGPELKGKVTAGDVALALKQLEREGRLGPDSSSAGAAAAKAAAQRAAAQEQAALDAADDSAGAATAPAAQATEPFSGAEPCGTPAWAARAPDAEPGAESVSGSRSNSRNAWLKRCQEFYAWLRCQHYDTKAHDACLHALMEMLAQDKAQVEKMTMGGRPIFSDLGNPKLQDLLCNGTEHNAALSDVIAHNQVLYLNLSTLRNPKTARLVGTMALRTLAHCAAGRIGHGGDPTMPPVDIYIDEASTLSSDTLLDLLNKTRAAKFHLTLLAQSVEDFYREGSRASCEHLIANCNVRIALRSMDRATSEQMTRLLGTIDQPTRSANLGGFESSSGTDLSASHSLSSQSVPLFEPSNLALLPNFEFIALLPSGTLYKGLIPRLVPSSFTHLHKSSKRYDQALSVISGAHPAA